MRNHYYICGLPKLVLSIRYHLICYKTLYQYHYQGRYQDYMTIYVFKHAICHRLTSYYHSVEYHDFTVSCQLSGVGPDVNMCYFRSFSVWFHGQYGVTPCDFAYDLLSDIDSILPPSGRSWMLPITVKSLQIFAEIVICVASQGGSHFCLRIPGESLAYSLSLWYVFPS